MRKRHGFWAVLLTLLLISGLLIGQPSAPPAGTTFHRGVWIGGGPGDTDGGAYISSEGDAWFEDLTTAGAFSAASFDHTALTTTGSSEGDVLTIVSGSPDWAEPSGSGSIGEGDITTTEILDGTILAEDLSSESVTSAKILDGTIATADIGNSQVTDAKVADDLTIDGGTVDDSVVGGTTPAAGSFTSLNASGNLTIGDEVLSDGGSNILKIHQDLEVTGGDVTIGNEVLSDGGTNTLNMPEVSGPVDGSVEMRLQANSGGTTKLYAKETTRMVVEPRRSSGDVYLDFNPTAEDGSGGTYVRFFRETNTTGTSKISVYPGTNSGAENIILDGSGDITTVGDLDLGGTLEAGSDNIALTNADGTINLEALEADGATSGEVLKWDGTDWAPAIDATGSTAEDTRSIILTAAGGSPTASNGCAQPELQTDGDVGYWTLEFDDSSDEYAVWSFAIPDDYDGETFEVEFNYRAANSSGSTKTVEWVIEAVAIDDSGQIQFASYGTSQSANDSVSSGLSDNRLLQVSTSSELTIGGSPSIGDMCVVRVMRDVSEDTLGVDAGLVTVKLTY